jgi:hypothetical protein
MSADMWGKGRDCSPTQSMLHAITAATLTSRCVRVSGLHLAGWCADRLWCTYWVRAHNIRHSLQTSSSHAMGSGLIMEAGQWVCTLAASPSMSHPSYYYAAMASKNQARRAGRAQPCMQDQMASTQAARIVAVQANKDTCTDAIMMTV